MSDRPGHLAFSGGIELRPGTCDECNASGVVLTVTAENPYFQPFEICGACVSRLCAELAAELADPRFAAPLADDALMLLVEERRARQRQSGAG